MEADSLQMISLNKRREAEMLLLKQQKNIADLKVSNAKFEEQRAKNLRNTFLAAVILTLIGIVVVLYFYLTKKRQHQDLTQAYSDLNSTKGKLERAEKRIVKLLRQQVSGGVAKALLSGDEENRVAQKFVCVMFLDIRDFTPMAEQMNPEELIAFQNKVFGFMIDAVERNHGTLNQLLGDGFMATFGAPVSHGNDCQNAFNAALEILTELKDRNKSGALPKTKVGIGLHAGDVVTGNVGNEARKQYSVTGNPVITASRVEQLNKEYKSQLIITQEVYDKLDQHIGTDADFIEVHVKGRSAPVRIMKIA
jgi:class 3 adenylate cyclase